ncbi:MAG: DUF4388 domain-containing protein [Thermoanaerobaculaceae bacterium]|nr:DUF4388 domain-containing protein [Thermoanaerobaculaceae bacterium]
MIEARDQSGIMHGALEKVGLPEILDFLSTMSKTGVLLLRNGNVTKTLHFKRGVVVFATSNIPDERFGEMLLREGKITADQFTEASKQITRGKRLGKILVEMQALSPKDLWNEVRHQVQEIAYSVLSWDSGTFQFFEGEERTGENITTSLTVQEILLEGLRRIKNKELLEKVFPSKDIVFERVLPASRPTNLHFEEYEKHVFKLVDSERTVQEICDLSEIGEFETLKTLYIFFSIGYLHVKKRKDKFVEEQKELAEGRQIVRSYNEIYSFLYHYFLREVGPIAENIMEKYLNKLKVDQPELFQRVTLRSNGTLSEERILENLKTISKDRHSTLIRGLNEFIYSILFVIRKTLGEEHERNVLVTLKRTRPDLFEKQNP